MFVCAATVGPTRPAAAVEASARQYVADFEFERCRDNLATY